MSPALLKATIKSNWAIGAAFMFIMHMYLFVMISMYDPGSMDGLIAMMRSLPTEIMSAMGMARMGTDLASYVGNFYYNLIAILFPSVYCIIVANRLIARHVDTGSMAYLLSTPNSRITIVVTQAVYLVASITALFVFLSVSGIAMSQSMFPGYLNVKGFILLNTVTMLVFYAVSGICFFVSCLFRDSKHSFGLCSIALTAFFMMNMLGRMGDMYSWMSRLTLFSMIDPSRILAEDSRVIATAVLVSTGIAIAAYSGGTLVFSRRSLPI